MDTTGRPRTTEKTDLAMKKKQPDASAGRTILRFNPDWTMYGLAVSEREDHKFRYCVTSFIEEQKNFMTIVEFDRRTFQRKTPISIPHPYPPSKVMFLPSNVVHNPDLLATTGDYLRLFQGDRSTFTLKSRFDHNKGGEFSAPLTSFDWCRTELSQILTASIDTTCTLWDIKKMRIVMQLIAHEKEVFDVQFDVINRSIFASCGRDGSVRVFDLRALEHSTIIFESLKQPIVRVSWNKQNSNYIGVFCIDSSVVHILDMRIPNVPVADLSGHSAPVNAIDWAPHSPHHLATCGDDSQVLIWDTSSIPKIVQDPILGYSAGKEANSIQWSNRASDWVAIGLDKELQILKV